LDERRRWATKVGVAEQKMLKARDANTAKMKERIMGGKECGEGVTEVAESDEKASTGMLKREKNEEEKGIYSEPRLRGLRQFISVSVRLTWKGNPR